jgi:hypothetical protein
MSLRTQLGGETNRVHELVDELLDGEDTLLVLIDGRRAISYAAGFGLSASQLELVAIEVERVVRAITGKAPIAERKKRRDAARAA